MHTFECLWKLVHNPSDAEMKRCRRAYDLQSLDTQRNDRDDFHDRLPKKGKCKCDSEVSAVVLQLKNTSFSDENAVYKFSFSEESEVSGDEGGEEVVIEPKKDIIRSSSVFVSSSRSAFKCKKSGSSYTNYDVNQNCAYKSIIEQVNMKSTIPRDDSPVTVASRGSFIAVSSLERLCHSTVC